MYRFLICLLTISALSLNCNAKNTRQFSINYVNSFLGTSGDANLLPVASVPFGMVQVGPDNHLNNAGYKYNSNEIIGFSHTHMSGGGCNDFKDIMFFPVNDTSWTSLTKFPVKLSAKFSHKKEKAEPGYYQVELDHSKIKVELTATERCGFHRYTYPKETPNALVIDLKYGHNAGCTVCPGEDYDTVRISHFKMVNEKAIEGYRVSDGWLKGVSVYFYTEFSKPILSVKLFLNNELVPETKELTSQDIKALLFFNPSNKSPLLARTGISFVSIENAKENLHREISSWNFDLIKTETQLKWEKQLSIFQIDDPDSTKKTIFYTLLYRSLFYPSLFSDVNGEFRSSDQKIHQGNFNYMAGALGLWDTFRAHNPLISILRPDVANDLMKTFIEHFNNCGQLPQWTGAGVENWCMIGLPANPIIADVYYKGIGDYDVSKLYEAMKISSNVDTFGYSTGNCVFKGTSLYKKYGYIPCDLDINSVAKTLEFAYSDWCLAQMAKMLGKSEDYNFYLKRAQSYQNLYDPKTKLIRPKLADGNWKNPFDPVFTNHYHPGDDYCEGTAFQWNFFVPHDINGLIKLMGGANEFEEQLDSLFIRSSDIHDGGQDTPDINRKYMIGQYTHSNEPCHHIIYLYNFIGKPWKTQKWISAVMNNLYNNSTEGLCGNDDTGQMSAWYVFNAMGFYPVNHGEGIYYIGTPLFKNLTLTHAKGKLKIVANHISKENIYIQSVSINGIPYQKNWLRYEDLFSKNTTLVFEMGNTPDKEWGSSGIPIE